MKKKVSGLLFLSLLVVSGVVFSQQKGDSFAAAQKSKRANLVYVHANVNGFAKTEGSGKTSGLLVDVMGDFENSY